MAHGLHARIDRLLEVIQRGEQLPESPNAFDGGNRLLTGDLDRDLGLLEAYLGSAEDLVVRKLRIRGLDGRPAAVVFIDGLAAEQLVSQNVVRPLIDQQQADSAAGGILDQIESVLVFATEAD